MATPSKTRCADWSLGPRLVLTRTFIASPGSISLRLAVQFALASALVLGAIGIYL